MRFGQDKFDLHLGRVNNDIGSYQNHKSEMHLCQKAKERKIVFGVNRGYTYKRIMVQVKVTTLGTLEKCKGSDLGWGYTLDMHHWERTWCRSGLYPRFTPLGKTLV